MQIQSINSYNQRSNVNFKATPGNFSDLKKIMNSENMADAQSKLAKLCTDSAKSGTVDVIVATSSFMKKDPKTKIETEVNRHLAQVVRSDAEGQLRSSAPLLPEGLQYDKILEILTGLVKSVL